MPNEFSSYQRKRRTAECASVAARAASLDHRIDGLQVQAAESMQRILNARASSYIREIELPTLLPGTDEDTCRTAHPAEAILALELALRAEQKKVRGPTHWSAGQPNYGRMIRLRAALLAERRSLEQAVPEAAE